MTKDKITKEILEEVMITDISIQTIPEGQDLLILICHDKESSRKLQKIISDNPYDLRVYVDETTGNYTINIEFIESEYAMEFVTGKNETSYPPIQKLRDKKITFITTGEWTGNSEQGRMCNYNLPLLRLGELNIGESLGRAKDIQLIASESKDEVPAVVLTFDDYDHIFASEADEAYNKLIQITKGEPILEIKLAEGETINLRIWDILVDLEVSIKGLKYNPEELDNFLKNVDSKKSFAFALGFIPPIGKKAALASTKKEGFELITLYGYSFKG